MVTELAIVGAVIVALGAIVLALGAELLHVRRCRRIARLAFGPSSRPSRWTMAAPVLRVLSIGALCWGLLILLLVTPKVHRAEAEVEENDYRHLMLVLDVSPSMRLQDAGLNAEDSRRQRSADLLRSFFERVPYAHYRTSVVAVYNGAKPVVVDTTDGEVIYNILNDLLMQYAFEIGETDLFAGLTEAARMARPWRPHSTTLILVSDGDTVPATGMPKMPASIADVLVVGVGDPVTGKFIDGRQSRQDASTLRQIAVRLNGTYHDGNEKHISTAILSSLTQDAKASPFEKLTLREYALIACGVGAAFYALLPIALQLFGTRFHPGVATSTTRSRPRTRTRRRTVAALETNRT